MPCPRATRSTTRRTASGRCWRARVPDEIATPHPRFGRDRWPERLAGRAVTAVDAHGKHLFLRFEGGLDIHSHLRMTGAWGVYRHGARWRRAPRRAWLVLRARGREVVAVRRPRAGADDRRRARASTSGSPRSAPTCSPTEFDESALPPPAARRRPDARRSATRCSTSGRSRASGTCGRSRAAVARGRRSVAPRARRLRRGGARRIVDARARACSARAERRARTAASGASTTAPAALPALRRRASARAARGTTTADLLVPGMPAMSRAPQRCAASATRAPTRSRPGNTPRELRRRARARRRHDRVRRAAGAARRRRTAASWCSRTTTATRTRARRSRSRRASPTSPRGVRGVELDVDLKMPGYEERVVDGAARARARRALARLLAVSAEPRARPRAGAGAAPRLVGPARAEGLHASRSTRAGLRGDPPRAAAAPGPRRRRAARRPLRRADVALAARHAARLVRGGARGAAASCTCGPSTTRRASARSRRSA